jgi:aryl-alcohol dehydrogenase-like predicted oxidoreductase
LVALAATVHPLGATALSVSRLGVGLAAIGRPGYITLGRGRDLPGERSPEALATRVAEVLDAAFAAGVRYVDVARSYGRAEEFLARWLAARDIPREKITIGSKWGYAYTAGWRIDAPVHEQKELSLERFTQQLGESRGWLGRTLDLYQIHSATAESGVLTDQRLLAAMVGARRSGAIRALGLTLTGADSRRTLDLALEARIDGERVFDVVQATFNLFESSLAGALRAARDAGLGVIAKEVFANGRLGEASERAEDRAALEQIRAVVPAAPLDQVALRFVLAHAFVDVALSGAATVAQLRSHAAARKAPPLDAGQCAELLRVAETPELYWRTRSALRWS